MDLSFIVNKDEQAVPVKIVHGNSESGTPMEGLSFETDDKGEPVLRVVDAAPFAYDPAKEMLKTLTTFSKKIKKIDISRTNVLSNKDDAGFPDFNNSDRVLLQPPNGKVWEILHLYFFASRPSESLEGTHQLMVRYGADASKADLLAARSTHSGNLQIKNGTITMANDTQYPEDKIMQKNSLEGVYATFDCPVYLTYQNQTDVTQANTRTYYYIVSETDEIV